VIKNYFKQFAQFADRDDDNKTLDQGDVRNAQRDLAREIGEEMKKHIRLRMLEDRDQRDPGQGKVKRAVQTYINVLWIQCVFAQYVDEHYLVEECNAPEDMRMDLVSMLKPVREVCTDCIVQTVMQGADVIIQRGSAERWDDKEDAVNPAVSDYMTKLSSHMQTKVIEHLKMLDNSEGASFASGSNIRELMTKDRDLVETRMFTAIDQSITSMICGKNVKAISGSGIKKLRFDIDAFVKQIGPWLSADMRPKHLSLRFGNAEAAQLCDIVLEEDVARVANDQIRASKYKDVKPRNVLLFLEKYMDTIASGWLGVSKDKKDCQQTIAYFKKMR